MPDDTQSDALKELRTVFPPSRREIETIALRQRRTDVEDELDLVFLIDITGSMSFQIADVAESLGGVAVALAETYSSVRYAVITFKDEDETVLIGSGFTDLAATQIILDGLTSSGGDDDPENGYGAIVLGSALPWRELAVKAMVLISDNPSHERGATYGQAEDALTEREIFFFSGLGLSDPGGYDDLVSASGGSLLSNGTIEQITLEIATALQEISADLLDPVYLVNDNQPLTAFLETGEEVTFANRSFSINPFNSGEDGALTVSLAIDNTDFAVSRYIALAKKKPIALECTFRIYINDDLTEPQNNPPLSLYATDFEIKGSTVSCQLRWVDLQNAPFPNAYYNSKRSPSLQ